MSGTDDAGGSPLPATQPLREEYASLQSVLSGMTALAGRVRGGDSVHPLLLVGALTYLDAFQNCHDRKIETALLPALKGREGSEGTVASNELVREHEDVRQRVAALRRVLAGSRRLNEATCRLGDECVRYLRAHAVRELEGWVPGPRR